MHVWCWVRICPFRAQLALSPSALDPVPPDLRGCAHDAAAAATAAAHRYESSNCETDICASSPCQHGHCSGSTTGSRSGLSPPGTPPPLIRTATLCAHAWHLHAASLSQLCVTTVCGLAGTPVCRAMTVGKASTAHSTSTSARRITAVTATPHPLFPLVQASARPLLPLSSMQRSLCARGSGCDPLATCDGLSPPGSFTCGACYSDAANHPSYCCTPGPRTTGASAETNYER